MSTRRRFVATVCALSAAVVAGGCAGVRERGPDGGAPAGVGEGWSQRMEDRRAAMARATRNSHVEVTRTTDNQLKLVYPSDISFEPGGYALKPQLRGLLDPFVGLLAGDRAAQLTVVGHTDSTGSDAVNNPLSLDRAQSVRDYLVGRGLSATQIRTIGRGAREPLADNATDAGRARNRRVEVFVREQASPA